MDESEDIYRLVGTTVAEKYAVERVAGSGGFAIVYRARHLLWDRPVALKVFKVLEVHPEMRQRLLADFHREGALLAELSERSSAIAQARDVGMLTTAAGDMVPFMVLEWLEGKTLDEILLEGRSAQKRYTFEQAYQLLAPAIDALALAHSRGIAHRDVKPANIFVVQEPDGRTTVKLLDFGIAKVVQDARKDAGEFAKTTGAVTSFTPLYGAPEQFSRSLGATGPWTDVFAMALIFVEMMSGQAPLEGDDLPQVAFASTNPNDRPTPRRRGVQVSDAVEAVFARALAVNVQERYASAGELQVALQQADADANAPLSTSLLGTGRRVVIGAPGAVAPHELAATQTAVPASLAATAQPKKSSALLFGSIAAVLALGAAAAFFKATQAPTDPGPVATMPSALPSTPALPAVVDAGPSCPKDMILVEGGQFFMGSAKAPAEKDEAPEHQVMLNAYCIDKYEVTVERFVACTKIGKCRFLEPVNVWTDITAAQKTLYDPICNLAGVTNGSTVPEGKGQYPINCVDYDSATSFCDGMGGRLPTEAEWEHAARGSDGRVYPWASGEPSPELLNVCGKECVEWGKTHKDPGNALTWMFDAADPYPTTAPVGSFPKGASVYGLDDMTGNVWEWVSDYYAPYPKDGAMQTNPTGPAKGQKRVIRGGGWNSSNISWMRPSFRFSAVPSQRTHGIGFRCASTPK